MGRFTVVDNNILDRQGILNLLKNFIFGNTTISIYDQNKVYNSGDKAFIIDASTGDIEVVTATENGVTGPYNPNKWTNMTLADTIGSGLDDVVVISPSYPTEEMTQIWLTPNEYSYHSIEVPDQPTPPEPITGSSINLLFTNAFPITEEAEYDGNLSSLNFGDIVIDWEDGRSLDVDGLTNIDSNVVMLLDEQDDISVSPTKPDEADPSIIWIDTDLTDD